jgi:hypothetical protein
MGRDELLILGSTVYRLIWLGSGMLAMFFGYRLLQSSGRTQARSGADRLAAKHGSSSLVLTTSKPGVFFALFGAAVIIAGLVRQPEWTFQKQTYEPVKAASVAPPLPPPGVAATVRKTSAESAGKKRKPLNAFVAPTTPILVKRPSDLPDPPTVTSAPTPGANVDAALSAATFEAEIVQYGPQVKAKDEPPPMLGYGGSMFIGLTQKTHVSYFLPVTSRCPDNTMRVYGVFPRTPGLYNHPSITGSWKQTASAGRTRITTFDQIGTPCRASFPEGSVPWISRYFESSMFEYAPTVPGAF